MRRRRFLAWTLTLTAALLAVVWVGSMRTMAIADVTPKLEIVTYRGCLFVIWDASGRSFDSTDFGIETLDRWSSPVWKFEGVTRFPERALGIPLWPFVLLTGVPGVWMLIKTRKHTNPHACPACGYDRTGLPQTAIGSAPCPECGKA